MSYNGPRNPNPGPGEAAIIIYNYVPSLALGIIGCVLFGLALVAHAFYFARKPRQNRVFQGLLAFACALEIVGYAFRIQSHYSPFLVNAFVVQYFMIVVAPVFIAAAFYLSLSYAIRLSPGRRKLLPIGPKGLFVFICFDAVTTIIQIAGAALIGTTESARVEGKASSLTPEDANHILLAGLAAQNASFLVFLVLLAFVFVRSRSTKYEAALPTKYLITITITSLLVFTRTLYRLGETAEGVFGFAYSSEALFGVFEFAPVILAVLIWAAVPLSTLHLFEAGHEGMTSTEKRIHSERASAETQQVV